MMTTFAGLVLVLCQMTEALQLSPPTTTTRATRATTRATPLRMVTRRETFEVAAAASLALSLPVSAASPKKVLVAGATGQTGRRIVARLAKLDGVEVVGGVRNVEKAAKSLEESSIAVRGAMQCRNQV